MEGHHKRLEKVVKVGLWEGPSKLRHADREASLSSARLSVHLHP